MKFTILTLFPDMFSPLRHSIIKRATESGKIQIDIVDFREYATNKHKKVDDTAFGGGAGMLIMAEPVVRAIEAIDPEHKAHRVFLTPAARTLTHRRVTELATAHDHIILLCGHYEGIDQRAIDLCIDECISIGEYVLTGGELAAMVVVDAISRYVPGVISADSLARESHTTPGVLEHPQYTKPRTFRGISVPEVLMSGNHAAIEQWKLDQSAAVTRTIFIPTDSK